MQRPELGPNENTMFTRPTGGDGGGNPRPGGNPFAKPVTPTRATTNLPLGDVTPTPNRREPSSSSMYDSEVSEASAPDRHRIMKKTRKDTGRKLFSVPTQFTDPVAKQLQRVENEVASLRQWTEDHNTTTENEVRANRALAETMNAGLEKLATMLFERLDAIDAKVGELGKKVAMSAATSTGQGKTNEKTNPNGDHAKPVQGTAPKPRKPAGEKPEAPPEPPRPANRPEGNGNAWNNPAPKIREAPSEDQKWELAQSRKKNKAAKAAVARPEIHLDDRRIELARWPNAPASRKHEREFVSIINKRLHEAGAPLYLRIQHARRQGTKAVTLVTAAHGDAEEMVERYGTVVANAAQDIDKGIRAIQKVDTWQSLKIHGVGTERYLGRGTGGLRKLREEMEAENEDIEVMAVPEWLSTMTRLKEGGKKAASVVFKVRNRDMRERLLKRGVRAAGWFYTVEVFEGSGPTAQCNICCQWGHATAKCDNDIPTRCAICARNHHTSEHGCLRVGCGVTGRPCTHTEFKCVNCDGTHAATNAVCPAKHEARREAIRQRYQRTDRRRVETRRRQERPEKEDRENKDKEGDQEEEMEVEEEGKEKEKEGDKEEGNGTEGEEEQNESGNNPSPQTEPTNPPEVHMTGADDTQERAAEAGLDSSRHRNEADQ